MGYGMTLMLLLICLSIGMYAMGQTNAIQAFQNLGLTSPNNSYANTMVLLFVIGSIGVGGIVATVLSGNFGVIYSVPAGVVSAVVLNLLFLPLGSLFNPAYPPALAWLLFLFLNSLFIGAVLSFIRGVEF
jgi:hypothetical protein